jgi:antitoxin YefM
LTDCELLLVYDRLHHVSIGERSVISWRRTGFLAILVQDTVQVGDLMNIVSFSEARTNLKQVCDRVVDDADHTIITRRDAEDVVVMSLESFNSLLETVHLLKSPANAAHLALSIEQFRQGQAKERALLDVSDMLDE